MRTSRITCSILTVPLDHQGEDPGHARPPGRDGRQRGRAKGHAALPDRRTRPAGRADDRADGHAAPAGAGEELPLRHDRPAGYGGVRRAQVPAAPGADRQLRHRRADAGGDQGVLGHPRRPQGPVRHRADRRRLQSLRQALGVPKMVVDGVSYGSFTAARYAAVHPSTGEQGRARLGAAGRRRPERRRRPVPHRPARAGEGPARRLHGRPACGYDPAGNLAWDVRHRSAADGVRIFDAIVSYQAFMVPTYRDPNPPGLPAGHGDLIGALHAARHGDTSGLDTILADFKPGGDPVESYSSGLHINASAPTRMPVRGQRGRAARHPPGAPRARPGTDPASRFWPYTRTTSAGSGFTQECMRWKRSHRGAARAAAGRPGPAGERRPRPFHSHGMGRRRGLARYKSRETSDRQRRVALDSEPRTRTFRTRCRDRVLERLTHSALHRRGRMNDIRPLCHSLETARRPTERDGVTVMVWMNPGAVWESAVDAAARLGDDEVVLLLVTEIHGGGYDALAELLRPPGHEPDSAERRTVRRGRGTNGPPSTPPVGTRRRRVRGRRRRQDHRPPGLRTRRRPGRPRPGQPGPGDTLRRRPRPVRGPAGLARRRAALLGLSRSPAVRLRGAPAALAALSSVAGHNPADSLLRLARRTAWTPLATNGIVRQALDR